MVPVTKISPKALYPRQSPDNWEHVGHARPYTDPRAGIDKFTEIKEFRCCGCRTFALHRAQL